MWGVVRNVAIPSDHEDPKDLRPALALLGKLFPPRGS
jgi:hypothetical protein